MNTVIIGSLHSLNKTFNILLFYQFNTETGKQCIQIFNVVRSPRTNTLNFKVHLYFLIYFQKVDIVVLCVYPVAISYFS